MIEDVKLQPGQNLRYSGKGFPGYIPGLPYMVFVASLNNHRIAVKYNGINVCISRSCIRVVK